MAEDSKLSMSDVAKPGTTPATASSKPVIVGHTTTVSDPMVSTPAPDKIQAAAKSVASAGSMKPRIEPTKAAQEVQKEGSKEDDTVNAAVDSLKKTDEVDTQVRLGELIESGEYAVSIKQKNASSNSAAFFGTVFAIVILAVLVLFVLTDLEIIDFGVKLPFELFK